MSTIHKILAQIPAFQSLDTATLQQLNDVGSIKPYERHEIIYQHHNTLSGLHILLTGHVKLYRESVGREQILALLRACDCFGTEALTDKPTSAYYAATLSPAEILILPSTVIQSLMEEHPQIRVAILQLATERLRQFALLVHNLAFRDVTARLAAVIIMRAETDGVVTENGVKIVRLMTQSELATMVGTAREVIQRTLKKFQNEAILQVSRKEFLILDMPRLRAIAQEENR